MTITRNRINAENQVSEYTRRKGRSFSTAKLGNNSGDIQIGNTSYVFIRLHGDSNQVVRAENPNSVPLQHNLPVLIERVVRGGIARYVVIGREDEVYNTTPYDNAVGEHATQHEIKDFGATGFDALNIYTRAHVELRARAQATPDMTLYVEHGKYAMNGTEVFWTGGTSPTFTAPAAGYKRFDLLYFNSSGALTVKAGTAAAASLFSVPPYPSAPTGSYCPLAYILLVGGQTTITETSISDARISWGALGSGAVGAHALDGALHTVSGLTTGHFLKSLSATTFGFAAHGLTYSDVGADASGAAATVQGNLTTHAGLTTSAHGGIVASSDARLSDARTPTAHDIISSHTYTGGAALDVFGLSAANTIARLTPSSNPGAAASLVATNSSGVVQLAGCFIGETSAGYVAGMLYSGSGSDALKGLKIRNSLTTGSGYMQIGVGAPGLYDRFGFIAMNGILMMRFTDNDGGTPAGSGVYYNVDLTLSGTKKIINENNVYQWIQPNDGSTNMIFNVVNDIIFRTAYDQVRARIKNGGGVLIGTATDVVAGSLLRVNGHITANTDSASDLGTTSIKWRSIYANNYIGSLALPVSVVSASVYYNALTTDSVIICNRTGGTYSVYLPNATGSNHMYWIKNISTYAVTVSASNGTDTIDDSLSQKVTQYETLQIVDYASGKWAII